MNIISVIVAAIVAMVVGYIWYSPNILGAQWVRYRGVRADRVVETDTMTSMYVVGFVIALIMAAVIDQFMVMTATTTLAEALTVAFLAWLGFVATSMWRNHVMNSRPTTLFLIDSGHELVVLLITAAVLFFVGI